MSPSKLFAERFLVSIGSDADEPADFTYDERRGLNVWRDGTPVVQLDGDGEHGLWAVTITEFKSPLAGNDQD